VLQNLHPLFWHPNPLLQPLPPASSASPPNNGVCPWWVYTLPVELTHFYKNLTTFPPMFFSFPSVPSGSLRGAKSRGSCYADACPQVLLPALPSATRPRLQVRLVPPSGLTRPHSHQGRNGPVSTAEFGPLPPKPGELIDIPTCSTRSGSDGMTRSGVSTPPTSPPKLSPPFSSADSSFVLMALVETSPPRARVDTVFFLLDYTPLFTTRPLYHAGPEAISFLPPYVFLSYLSPPLLGHRAEVVMFAYGRA